MNILLTFLLFSVPLFGWADDNLPTDAFRELSATHNPFVIRSFAVGTFSTSGRNAVVAVIREAQEGGEFQQDRPLTERSLTYRIVMLTEDDDRKERYKLVRETQQLGELRGVHEFHVDIKKGALFLHTSDKRSYSDWHFKTVKGELRLIGVERVESSPETEDLSVTVQKSINFLTGIRQTVTTKITNGKKSVSEAVTNRFSLPPLRFQDFRLESGLSSAIDG